MALIYSPNIVRSGLVLALDAADRNSYPGSGTTWRDLSGNNNNGTLTNGPTYNSANGGSIVFDGSDDLVNCGNGSSLAITGDISICMWVYITSFSGYNGLVGKTSANSLPGSYDSYTNAGGGIVSFLRGNGDFAFSTVSSTNPLTINTWQHIGMTMTGTTVAHYLNGNANGGGTLSTTVGDNGSSVYIGNRGDNFTDMNGRIASTQIYNRALSQAEVLQNYNAVKSRFGL
jgi:hypothetical protein